MRVLGIVAFVVVLLVSVALHEAGHLVTAKRFGMKATQFFVGFGPRLWSFHRGETEYGIKAIPAGGYVKIIGMTALEETDPADADRLFYTYPARQRVVVLSAGSFMHFVIAVALTYSGLLLAGTDVLHSHLTSTIGQVSDCVDVTVTQRCDKARDPASPARVAGLRAGDHIVAVQGVPVRSWTDVTTVVRANPGRPVSLTVTARDGQRTVTLTPVPATRPNDSGGGSKIVGVIGVSPSEASTAVNPLTAIGHTFADLRSEVGQSFVALARLPGQVPQLFSNKPRDGTGVAGVVDIARVSGGIAATHGESLGHRLALFLLLMASVNLFVGIFNLLPLLPLDGGHIAILLFEKARSKVAVALGRADPGRVDLLKVLPVAYAVIAAFVGLTLLLVYAGIANPIKLS